mmetsp:Transcript_14655/g.42975  ORF Transcript_14655/g.42975 Transcript_14655/m.42975 type:complete len:348 (+) Transcript_14655:648-1691(+)
MPPHVPTQVRIQRQDEEGVIPHETGQKIDHEKLDLEFVRVGSGRTETTKDVLGQPLRIANEFDRGVEFPAVFHTLVQFHLGHFGIFVLLLRPLSRLEILPNATLLLPRLLAVQMKIDRIGTLPLPLLLPPTILVHAFLDAQEEAGRLGHDGRVRTPYGRIDNGDGALVGPYAATVQFRYHVDRPLGRDVRGRFAVHTPQIGRGISRGSLTPRRSDHPMKERLDRPIHAFVPPSVLVHVADVVHDVAVQLFPQRLVGNGRHDAEEQLQQAEGFDGALVAHNDEGRDDRFADLAVEVEGRGGDGDGEFSSSARAGPRFGLPLPSLRSSGSPVRSFLLLGRRSSQQQIDQ